MIFKLATSALLATQLAFFALSTPITPNVDDLSALQSRAPSTFKHPGVLVDKAQLDFIKSKVAANAEPWKSAYKAMLSDPLASRTRTPSARATVECGPTSKPDIGCSDEKQDALAAYANALAWYISGTASYAQKAISYMNAWSSKIKAHTNSNAPLQTGWSGATWARAGEIIRYSNAGWAAKEVTAFENMLRNVYLPEVIDGSKSNGNWELVMMEAAIGISVFLNDGKSYDKAMNTFLARVPAYVYLTSDGPCPRPQKKPGVSSSCSAVSKYWYDQSKFLENGIAQETCRDFTHTGYGLSSISHVAETARIQGNDLYSGDVGTRLRYGLEFHSKYELGASVPSWLCDGKDGKVTLGLGPITEVGYNALANRRETVMASTGKLTIKDRPAGENKLFVGWETLTHGNNTA